MSADPRVRRPASALRPPRSAPGRWATVLAVVGVLALGAAGAPELDEQVRAIAQDLRCPVCQNLSTADSPSGLANQMRGVIREKLQAGENREQIEAYFVEKYGEWVLLAPRKRGFNLVAWLLPFAGVIAGGVGVAVLVRRWAAGREEAAAGGAAPTPPDPALEAYRERLRKELEDFAR